MSKKIIFFIVSLLVFPRLSLAHEGHHHGPHTHEAKLQDGTAGQPTVAQSAGELYDKNVRPILEMKCAACHSATKNPPWYSSIPVFHQKIAYDRREAQEHLEISKGYPFGGHGDPTEDLTALQDVVTHDTMPTPLYSFFYPAYRLNADEKRIIMTWVTQSLAQIQNPASSETHK